MAASTASPGPRTPIWASRPGSISRAGCSPRRAPRRCSSASSPPPKYTPAPIAFGTNTDPYQPIERQYRITRSLLETLQRVRHPLSIVTKSNLVLRDLDILSEWRRDGLVKVFLSVTTLDRELARKMEPRAPTPAEAA